MKAILFFWKNLDQFRLRFLLCFATALVAGATDFAIFILLAEFTKEGILQSNLWLIMTLLTSIILINLCAAFIIRRYGESLVRQWTDYIKLKYFKKMEMLKVFVFQNKHSGYIFSLINSISENYKALVFQFVWVYPLAIIKLIIFYSYIGMQSSLIALINFIMFIIFIGVSSVLSYKMAKIAKEQYVHDSKYNERIVDFMTNILTVRKLGINNYAEQKLDSLRHVTFDWATKHANGHSNRWFILHFIFFSSLIISIGYFLYAIAQGDLSTSVLILFVPASLQVKNLSEAISESLKRMLEMNEYISTIDDIFVLEEEETGIKNPKNWKALSIKNIAFQHAENKNVIKIPELVVERGNNICISGKSGQGKSTILSIIIGYINNKGWERKFDDIDYKDITKNFFTNQMIYVAQEIELFNLTLRENLTLGSQIKESKLIEFLKELDLIDWVNSLEKGLDTVVGEKGLKLSAGQKQRINLLRAVIMNKEIYLLDEPTSHLDHRTEEIVIDFIKKYLSKKTLVIVTHREAIKSLCDTFYVMERHKLEKAWWKIF